MSTLLRYLRPFILDDLKEKMVFLGGPRQVGKTTFSQSLIPHFTTNREAYINWDNPSDKKIFLNALIPPKQKLIIFDEIHKYKNWRNTIKGYWDSQKDLHQFLVTGSARLDYYRKGGDSLLGRYHYYRMHPLSLPEVSKKNSAIDMEHLLKFGGFPEPFLRGSERTLRRWHNQRTSRIVSDDIRELEQVKELSLIELLINALPERVGSPLSRKNLAQELGVDFKTIEKWLTILESIYYSYRISPFGPPKIRAVKKEQKLYLWDWSEHIDEGKVWENFVGSHLLKYCHFHEDYEGHKMELRFLRDTDGREIDFIVLKNKKALFAVECKTGEKNLSRHISYFAERTDIPIFYQVHRGSKHIVYSDKVALLPFNEFCKVENLI